MRDFLLTPRPSQGAGLDAVIHIDPKAIHPVVDGEWHRARLPGIPQAGQGITMLCGLTASARFQPLDQRRDRGVPTACPRCDSIYRREHGIPQQDTRQSR
ncbi:hypothetical protein [Amycolatopsis solani]|uniref:hypothetical protein n=1 Tax=Amycolatopsis solani TaxID=3028615 RepID=UPI0025B0BDAE|nr:hypothetical protein [Amycolatopsis sp. MEP2-6]